jgi:5-methylcytosine-specific restriction endonuclease McrA
VEDKVPYKTKEERHANYLANKEKQLAQGKTWAKANRESRRAQYTAWAKKYPEKVKTRRKAHYEANREESLEYSRKFRKEHPELVKQALTNWRINNPEKVRAHWHKRRAARLGNGGSYTYEQWIALCDKYSNRCLCCGKKKKLTADHVIPLSKGGTSWIENIQPLCLLCNLIKNAKTIDYRDCWEMKHAGHSSRGCRSRHRRKKYKPKRVSFR